MLSTLSADEFTISPSPIVRGHLPSSTKKFNCRAMLAAEIIPALVSTPCPSLSISFASATAKQRHKSHHLPLGFVQQYLSLYCLPSPSSSLSPLTSTSPSLSPFTSCFPFDFAVPFSPPWVSCSPSLSSMSLPSPESILPPLGAAQSAQFSSSSFSSIVSSQ